ncbi:unnamed protein product [Enterobius vermicularis]|uniref:Protein-serine/threonine kinase n=1 Tax=Enterobius vermicularis TaxID=51028 RepID=A0A0N4VDY4_ENTVE|nr:unnamed protein product [Enterobius vermicularis]
MPVYDQTVLDTRVGTGSTISFATIPSCFEAAHPVKAGGLDKIIKVYEMVLTQRKNNRRKPAPHQWCFGGFAREGNECFIAAVEVEMLLRLSWSEVLLLGYYYYVE